MIFRAIAAVDRNWAIGKDNSLLYTHHMDTVLFQTLTMNQTVLMGANTFRSIGCEGLLGRTNLVLSRSMRGRRHPGTIVLTDLRELAKMDAVESQLRGSHETCVWVMGGGEVYETMLPFCRDAVLTMNTREYQADTWFPNLQEMGWPIASEPVEWEEWLKTCVFTNPDPRPFGEMAWKA